MASDADLARMYALLSVANEAILRSDSSQDLFRKVCDAAVDAGQFREAVATIPKASGSSEYVVARGLGSAAARTIPPHDDIDHIRTLVAEALRTGLPSVSNDCLEDPRLALWRKQIGRLRIGAAAAFPIVQRGTTVAMLVLCAAKRNAWDGRTFELMQRLAENVSFGLKMFGREEQRRSEEQQKERLARMFAALSATNEAIMRARTRNELFEMVCDAAVHGGKFNSTSIALVSAGSGMLRVVAASGSNADEVRNSRFATSEATPEGRGVTGTAFRTGRPSVVNDFLNDKRTGPWHESARRVGVNSAAALPLSCAGRCIGVILFNSTEVGTFTSELTDLLERLAENASFALESFDRAEQKDRQSRMFAALIATNEAIMRAGTPLELCQQVCDAAALGGDFATATIRFFDPQSNTLDLVATAGPDARLAKELRLPVDDTLPERWGSAAIAFKTGRPYISNDYLADPRMAYWHDHMRRGTTRSGASWPLFKGGLAVGALLFMSRSLNTFDAELAELLQRLADNVSFALDNLARIEAKTEADRRIAYLAAHDSLTGLPNRETFNQLLHFSIEAAKRHDRRFAVLFIDLDRFKVINDSLGHEAGDALLVEIANRLRNCLRRSDVMARLGGDEFVVILEHSERHQVELVAENLLKLLSRPMEISGHECHISASMGISMFPDDGADVQSLTKNADMAMYFAKEDGKNAYRFFTANGKIQSVDRLRLETSLRRALEHNEFVLHYQPKIDLMTRQVTGVEALVRWMHPELGMLPPAQFIPLAEETGLIVPIGRWVFRQACLQAVAWCNAGLPPVSMAVNLSPRQFIDERLLASIDEALADSGLLPELLQLEVTESMVMQNVDRAIKILDALQRRGIRLAIDDFGTGYSSMSLMKQFPIDTIKIDRSFVRDLSEDSQDQAIAQAIISMGKALRMTVVAEGVETTEQESFLRDHDCDEMQGYLFSKPIPADNIAQLLRDRGAAPPLVPQQPLEESERAARICRIRAKIA